MRVPEIKLTPTSELDDKWIDYFDNVCPLYENPCMKVDVWNIVEHLRKFSIDAATVPYPMVQLTPDKKHFGLDWGDVYYMSRLKDFGRKDEQNRWVFRGYIHKTATFLDYLIVTDAIRNAKPFMDNNGKLCASFDYYASQGE